MNVAPAELLKESAKPAETASSTRHVYLLSYPNRLFAAHWSLWVPLKGSSEKGTRIHVTGDSLNGFTHQFERDYIPGEDSRHPWIQCLGSVDDLYILEPPEAASDTVAYNQLEKLALSVEAPGPSLNRASSQQGPRTRVELKNCQTWMRDYVQLLIEKHVLPEEAQATLDECPKN